MRVLPQVVAALDHPESDVRRAAADVWPAGDRR
jgi:hypothetical protein